MRTRNEPVGLPPFDRIRSVEELCRAVRSGRLRGFGEKSERKLVAALAKPQAEKRFKLSEAEAEAEALLSHLRGSASDGQVIVCRQLPPQA